MSVHVPYDGSSYVDDFEIKCRINWINDAGEIFDDSLVTEETSGSLYSSTHLIESIDIKHGWTGKSLYKIGPSKAYQYLHMILEQKEHAHEYGYYNKYTLKNVDLNTVATTFATDNNSGIYDERSCQILKEHESRTEKYKKLISSENEYILLKWSDLEHPL